MIKIKNKSQLLITLPKIKTKLFKLIFGIIIFCLFLNQRLLESAISRTDSRRFWVEAADAKISQSLTLMLEEMGRHFDALMEQRDWESPIHLIMVEGQTSLQRQIQMEDGRLRFTLLIPSPDQFSPIDLAAAVGELLCYELSTRDAKQLQPNVSLPRIPFWLVDGIGQNIWRPGQEDLIRIVYGCMNRKRFPAIEQIQSWAKPAGLRIERSYQSAFHFWVVRQLTYSREERLKLSQWIRHLGSGSGEEPVYWPNLKEAELWWTTALFKSTREPLEPFYSQERTLAELYRLLPTYLNEPEKGEPRLYSFELLSEAKQDVQFYLRLQEKAGALQRLVTRSNPLYVSLILEYLAAVQALLDKKPESEFMLHLGRAQEWLKHLHALRGSLNEYLDWFEISHANAEPERDFFDYFNQVRKQKLQER